MQGVIMRTLKILLPLLLLHLKLVTGVRSLRLREIDVKAGEMVALQCPLYRGYNHGDAKVIWISHTPEEMNLTNSLSPAEQRQMGVLVHGQSLVIFNTSVNHQGNYSCSTGNASRQFWFSLAVHTTRTKEYEEGTTYSKKCYAQESCTLKCPDENVPPVNTPNITSNGIIWHKEGESLPQASYFLRVKESDCGVYTCTRSYLHHGHIYNRSFTVVLDVKPKKKKEKPAVITSPHMGDVFYVDLGSTVVIDCKTNISSPFDEVFWLSGESFVDTNSSSSVFYNYTRESDTEGIKMTASLVFKKVSKEDLSRNYTCKLESVAEPSSFVTVTLAQKVVYEYVKMDVALFLRDTVACYPITSDGKSYDAFLMCYKSDTDARLNEDGRKQLKSVLENTFAYSFCIYDQNILRGKSVAEAELDCMHQNQRVDLVPTSQDPSPGPGKLNSNHEALVVRQTRSVLIKTVIKVPISGSLAEALQCSVKARVQNHRYSKKLSSFLWKLLHSYLHALQHAPRTRLEP